MSTRREKLCIAVLALVLLVAGICLFVVGSFVPYWASERNSTVYGNVSYSLWSRHECFSRLCTTERQRVRWTHEACLEDKVTGREKCNTTTGYSLKTHINCRAVNFCNSTWIDISGKGDDAPSLLTVARAFTSPAICSAFVTIVLYVIKLVLFLKKPDIKSQHLKAAYLTFGAIAGVVSLVGVTVFCTMLDDGRYERRWAPFLVVAGGVTYVLFGFGGYLRWRDNTAGGAFEDDTSLFDGEMSEFRPSESSSRPNAHVADGIVATDTCVLRQSSLTDTKAPL